MPIITKNFSVGEIQKVAPTADSKAKSFKDIREHLAKQSEVQVQKPKKDLSKINSEPQVTKELPKYVDHEHGELVRKINTKSQYMRDIFDLDS